MVVQQPPHLYTFEDFQQFISLPENEDGLFELIDGKIIEVLPYTTKFSEYSHLIAFAVRAFCHEHKIPCHTSGWDGAYNVQRHVLVPNFAYKITPMSDEYPDPVAPLWAVEIISMNNKASDIRKKRRIYNQAGILLWEVYPLEQLVDVYMAGKLVQEADIDDTLDGGDVLVGFTLAVRDIFVDQLAN